MKRIITINRSFGSNGKDIGKALAKKLGIHCYDKELIQLAAEQNDMSYKELEEVDEKRASMWRYPVDSNAQMRPQYRLDPMNDQLVAAQSDIIRTLAEKEDCIIIGRCANNILKDQPNSKSVFIHASMDYREKVIMERENCDERSARNLIKKMDKQRKHYYEYYTDHEWMDMEQYDICLDSSRLSMDQIVEILAALYQSM